MPGVKKGDKLQVEEFARGSRTRHVVRTYEVLAVSDEKMKLKNVRGKKEFWVPRHMLVHHSDLITHIKS